MNVLGKILKITKLFRLRQKKNLIKKEMRILFIIISYKIKFINSARFMGSLLSNLVNNLAERFTKLNVKIVIVFLNMKVLGTKYKCISYNKDYSNKFMKN